MSKAKPKRAPAGSGRPKGRRPTIGYLVSEIQRDFALWPWLGMVDAARQHDVNFVTFIGGILRPMSGFGGQANVLCELAGTECLDGLIIWPPVMGGYLTQPEIEEFCRRYHPSLPVVLLQEVIQDIPRVTIDDYQGFCLAVDHLIETHGYRRIAFAGMFESHIGFRARYRAYTDTMAARGLPVEARLAKAWFPDEVIYPSGRIHEEVFDAWLGQVLKTGVDAIVGVCDTIALEIIELLKARGVRIPGDVAVASFDDFRQSQVVTPPLTTANPSFYELGQQAVEILLALLDGQSVPEEVVVPPRLMVRQSCGCMDPTVEQVAVGPVKASRKSFKAGLATRREEILAEMAQAMGASEAARERSEQLLDYFAAEVTGEPSGGFLRELDEGLQRAAGHDDIAAWQGAISALRRHALPYLGGETLSRAEDLWQQARVLIGQVAQRQQAYEELQAAQQADVLREIGAALITTFDVGELMDTLAQNLPGVGIPSCYLSLYEAPPPYQYPQPAPEWSWLILAYNKKGHIELETGGQRFRSRELMLKKLWPQDRPFSFVVESLYFQESQLGFVLFEVGPREGATYKALCTQISSAVQGALLVQRVQERSAALARQQYILDTFMANVPDSIYFKDRHSRITHANPAHARGLGLQYVADEIGKTDFDFFPEEQARPKYEREQEIIRSGRPVLALEEPCANGRWVLTTKMPLRDEKGEIVGTFGISRDITELKRMQVRLEKANVEISTLNERLKAENVRMEAELDVTRRLQQMLLPTEEELRHVEGLDIAGFMLPADEVGGDYYDVLQYNGSLKIGIGDVTGHGLESGVVMLMLQTAVRTLQTSGVEDPVYFMDILNRLLHANLQRMNVDKSMTLALLDYEMGRLRLSGQHEQLIVARRGGKVELIDTIDLGFPLGIEGGIARFVKEMPPVELKAGDGVVLYSDGITEAENEAKEFYGLERLCQVVSAHWDKPAEAIKDAVVADVRGFIGQQKIYDDLTLLVVKQK